MPSKYDGPGSQADLPFSLPTAIITSVLCTAAYSCQAELGTVSLQEPLQKAGESFPQTHHRTKEPKIVAVGRMHRYNLLFPSNVGQSSKEAQ